MSRILVLALVLAFAPSARAEKVDWSEYIDKNPSAPIKTSPTPAPKEVKAAPAKPAATKVAAKPKAKPKARAKAKPRAH